jgi:hypothetical protein
MGGGRVLYFLRPATLPRPGNVSGRRFIWTFDDHRIS